MWKTRSEDQWGHPVGVRAAAEWSLCPELALPAGVAGTACQGATCMVVCDEGKVAIGKRRVKCRWTRKKGFFWKTVSRGSRTVRSLLDMSHIILLILKVIFIKNFRLYLSAEVVHRTHHSPMIPMLRLIAS